MLDRSIAPAIHAFEDVRLDYPQAQRLPNGIEMWVIGDGEDEINRITWLLPGGKFQQAKPMLASITASVLFEGSECYDAAQVSDAFDFTGASRSSASHDHYTEVRLSSLNDNLQHILPVFVNCVVAPSFPKAEVDVKCKLFARNLANMQQKVNYLAGLEMNRLYYGPRHPLAQACSPAQIESYTTDDFRAFHNSNYSLANSKLIVSGHITSKELNTISSVIGSLPVGKANPHIAELPICPSNKMLSIVDKKGAVQSAISMTIRAIPRSHPDYLLLRLLVTALGGYFGSRLMTNIREDKGYTYGIYSILAGRANDSYVGISTECDAAYTHQVISEVKHEIARLREQPIGIEELKAVKQYMLSNQMMTLDTPFSIAEYVGSRFLYGVYPDYFNDQIRTILTATPQQLQQIAIKYLNLERLRIVIAGDKEKMALANDIAE